MLDPIKIGARLRALRKEMKMNQDAVAQAIDTSQVNYSHMENGKQYPTLEQMVKLKHLFHTTFEYLIEGK